jgi:hypothetical protein
MAEPVRPRFGLEWLKSLNRVVVERVFGNVDVVHT